MLESFSSNFANIVTVGGRIEYGLKNGKITQGPPIVANARKPGFNPNKKKEGELQATSTVSYWRGPSSCQNKPNYVRSSPYVANATPTYQQNFPRPQFAY